MSLIIAIYLKTLPLKVEIFFKVEMRREFEWGNETNEHFAKFISI